MDTKPTTVAELPILMLGFSSLFALNDQLCQQPQLLPTTYFDFLASLGSTLVPTMMPQQKSRRAIRRASNESNPWKMSTQRSAIRRASNESKSWMKSTRAVRRASNESVRRKNTEEIAKREDEAVGRLRMVVFGILVLGTCSISGGVFFYSRNDQVQVFEEVFTASSDKLIKAFHSVSRRRLEAVDSVSVAITSHALSSGETFPFVTVPNYEYITTNARTMAEATIMNYSPLVTEENRAAWEEYAMEHRGQFWEAVETGQKERSRQDTGLDLEGGGLGSQPHYFLGRSEKIWNTNLGDVKNESDYFAMNGTGPYFPSWQIGPAIPFPLSLNYNTLSHPAAKHSLATVMESNEAVIDFATNLNQENYGETGAYMKLVLANSQYRDKVKTYLGDPISLIVYPVFDKLDSTNRTLAGAVTTNVYWRLTFLGILPESTRGVVCVVENSFDQKMTFVVDGTNATYVGSGDLHDEKFDRLKVCTDLNSYFNQTYLLARRSYTSVNLNDFGRYKICVYPSKELQDQFYNMEPIVAVLAVVSIFFFTSIGFVTYDCWVSRRQVVVLDRAIASSAIVSSLFPNQIRDQLYQVNPEEDKVPELSRSMNQSMDFMASSSSLNDAQVPAWDAPRIAQVYDNTTILFADLAGFTKWCSTREPEHVFELLETIYSAFDKIAHRRKVYKTIGDCYVAVTGLPDPQPNHATIMVRFAHDCMSRMNRLTRKLVAKLGEDTTLLELRVGLHSGSVTGGVLRGQKARFQLFGDAMNTASRMESNGVQGQIHVSEATAMELRAAGKPSWLLQRADKVQAKGKGELQTYFVNIPPEDRVSSKVQELLSDVSSDDHHSIQVFVDIEANPKKAYLHV